MKLNAGIITSKLAETRQFYVEQLGFGVTFENEWYLLLHTPNKAFEISFLLPNLESQAKIFQTPFANQGVYLTIEMEDVDTWYAEVQKRNIPIEVALKDEPWGDRHFAVVDPNGIGIDFVRYHQPEKMFDFVAGETLLIDKPYEWTSFDVVKKVRNAIRIKKVGHAGTLDPLATGLLILCTGKATKTINDLMGQVKEYTGTFTLGMTTPSFDMETEADQTFDISGIEEEAIRAATQGFMGEFEQTAPIYSALKVKGKPMYELARAGKKVEPKKRMVKIDAFEITRIALPEVDFRVVCSKGTYIRSLAHDFGKALDNGACLTALRRTRIGEHRIEDAWDLQELVERIREEKKREG